MICLKHCSSKSSISRTDRPVWYTALLLLTLLLLGNAEESVPPENLQNDDVRYLDQLFDMKITSGSFLDLNLQESPLSMTIITRSDISISGARNMSELLEIFVPGFQYMFNKWNGTLWGMRGVANDRNTKIIYLIDGHKMNTQARDGFQGETVLGLLGDIERVEVLRGPAGLVYGSGAIAGIVNVVTDKKTNRGSSVNTALSTSGGQQIEANIHAEPAEDQNVSVSFGFRRADGLAIHSSHIYGFGSWPFPGNGLVKTGVPSDGRYGSTDGNWRVAGSWEHKNIDAYVRITRQKESAGAFFIQDPWPEIIGYPDSTSRSSSVGQQTIKSGDMFWNSTESWGCTRFIYLSDNVLVAGNYTVPLGMNKLMLHAGYDRNTTRTMMEDRHGYESDFAVKGDDYYDGTFGETRWTGNAIFHLNSVPRLQAACGLEYRLDQIGKDMSGRDDFHSLATHPIVTEIDYQTFSLFGEGNYQLNNLLDLHFGGRLDFHTRAFMVNPKIALIFKPAEKHTIKLIGQSSSNNGSADNYEYNRFHFRDDGTVSEDPGYPNDLVRPLRGNEILQPAPPLDSLHNLKPEKVYALELAYTGTIFDNLTLTPSVSVGQVKDLFGWSQMLYRLVNAGSYKYFNLDFDAGYKTKRLAIGANHTFQRPFATNVESEETQFKIYSLPEDGKYYDSTIVNGTVHYYPITADTMSDYGVNIVKDAITRDGRNFLNLNTHITKLYVTFTPVEWCAFHTNIRLFWGLPGRKELQDKDPGFNYWNIADGSKELGVINYLKKSVSKKVNCALHFYLPKDIEIGLFVYDLLGIDHPEDNDLKKYTINTLRWQAQFDPAANDLYSTDQQTFGMHISKSF